VNRCMRTGFMFRFGDYGPTLTGDLFLTDEGLQIRGIPKGVNDGHSADAVIAPIDLLPRAYGRRFYRDSLPGVQIVSCTDEFRAFVAEWSPAMLDHLP
jgi:hypothetical protein